MKSREGGAASQLFRVQKKRDLRSSASYVREVSGGGKSMREAGEEGESVLPVAVLDVS